MTKIDAAILRRRDFLRRAGGGIGTIALANLLADEGRTADRAPEVNPFGPKPPHFPAKAKNVIFLYMEGAPSQLDLFDPKPELAKKFDEQGGDRHQVINDGINKALVSIKNLCEGKGGKVETARP